MKKHLLITALCLAAVSMNVSAQANWFDPEDVDENGWLWFDTQEKIDKYVGFDGTKILLVPADYENEDGENPEPFASPTVKGVGSDGVLASGDCRTGAIVLSESSGMMQQNGGSIMMQLPSCLDMAVCLSSEATMLTELTGGKGWLEPIDLAMIKGKCTVFMPLSKEYQYVYSGMALEENASTGLKLYSEDKVTARFRNCNKYPLYIHGIKVIVKGEPTGVMKPGHVATEGTYYNLLGQPVTDLTRGIFIHNGKKIVIR